MADVELRALERSARRGDEQAAERLRRACGQAGHDVDFLTAVCGRCGVTQEQLARESVERVGAAIGRSAAERVERAALEALAPRRRRRGRRDRGAPKAR